jgi:positive regulator of sigma E activity
MNHREAALVYLAILVVGIVGYSAFAYFGQNKKCEALGGTLVRGVFQYACVKELK